MELMNWYSSLKRVLRITTYATRFIKSATKSNQREKDQYCETNTCKESTTLQKIDTETKNKIKINKIQQIYPD